LVNALFGYFVKSFDSSHLHAGQGARPGGDGRKKYRKLQVWARGWARGAADAGVVGQRPVGSRAAVRDGHYDIHHARV